MKPTTVPYGEVLPRGSSITAGPGVAEEGSVGGRAGVWARHSNVAQRIKHSPKIFGFKVMTHSKPRHAALWVLVWLWD